MVPVVNRRTPIVEVKLLHVVIWNRFIQNENSTTLLFVGPRVLLLQRAANGEAYLYGKGY